MPDPSTGVTPKTATEELCRANENAPRRSDLIDNSHLDTGVPMRRFFLRRRNDETGISRTGRVLEGVVTQSGRVITEWRPPHSTVGIYSSMAEFLTIHVDCHPSSSDVVWIDEPQEET